MSARPIASICCSPPESVPPAWLSRSPSTREQLEDHLEVRGRRVPVGLRDRAQAQVLAHRQAAEDPPALGTVGDAQRDDPVRRGAGDVGALEA